MINYEGIPSYQRVPERGLEPRRGETSLTRSLTGSKDVLRTTGLGN